MSTLRVTLAAWCRRLADWLQPPATPPDALLAHARTLVAAQEQWPDRSGEAKRHQVYAALIEAFPAVSRRVISRVIEDALDRP